MIRGYPHLCKYMTRKPPFPIHDDAIHLANKLPSDHRGSTLADAHSRDDSVASFLRGAASKANATAHAATHSCGIAIAPAAPVKPLVDALAASQMKYNANIVLEDKIAYYQSTLKTILDNVLELETIGRFMRRPQGWLNENDSN